MAAEYDTKAVLLDWMKEGENKHCSECRLPSPQWCSLSYGTTLCLSCSGTHRSLGVHLSFVRSLTMDKWTPNQIARMLNGGNAKAREFFELHGEPWKRENLNEKYNTHAAAMYRDKLLADAEGRAWTESDTPLPSSAVSSSDSSASTRSASAAASSSSSSPSNSLRKPRITGGGGGGGGGPTNLAQAAPSASSVRKAQNENYFARMGSQNAQRSADLPPSQGGRYSGFGSQSSNPSSSSSGSGGVGALSSRALPGFDDLRDDPVGALGKGWGFLGAALGAVSKTVNDSVIQPGLERAHDPALQSQFSSFLSTATSTLSTAARTGGQVLSTGLESGSQFLKRDLGVDVGDLGAHYLDRATGRGAGEGYGRVGEEWAPRVDDAAAAAGSSDFFESQLGGSSRAGGYRDGQRDDVGGGGGYATMAVGSTASDDQWNQKKKVIAPIEPPREDDWSSFAPKAAAARRAREQDEYDDKQKSKPQEAAARKSQDGWDDFEEF